MCMTVRDGLSKPGRGTLPLPPPIPLSYRYILILYNHVYTYIQIHIHIYKSVFVYSGIYISMYLSNIL